MSLVFIPKIKKEICIMLEMPRNSEMILRMILGISKNAVIFMIDLNFA